MMEALSPRSANIPSKPNKTYKMETEQRRKSPEDAAALAKAAEKRAEKEKNHASAPPQCVLQPPGLDGSPEEKYMTGRLLGKGGFAICHEAKLMGSKSKGKSNRFALKIVKANMGIKKMEEKVSKFAIFEYNIDKHSSSALSCKSTPRCAIPTLSSSIVRLLIWKIPTLSLSYVRMAR